MSIPGNEVIHIETRSKIGRPRKYATEEERQRERSKYRAIYNARYRAFHNLKNYKDVAAATVRLLELLYERPIPDRAYNLAVNLLDALYLPVVLGTSVIVDDS